MNALVEAVDWEILQRLSATPDPVQAADDVKKLRHYFDTVVQKRSKDKGGPWEELYKARGAIA